MKHSGMWLLALSLVVGGCSGKNEPIPAEQKIHVTVAAAEKRTYHPELKVTGALFAMREANLGSPMLGRVEKIYFDEGERVKKGDLIAELSHENVTRAYIDYITTEKDFYRVKRLYDKGSTSEQRLDHVRAAYECKKKQYDLLKKNAEIRAPFGGVVVEHMIEEGETFIMINPGLDPGYSIANGIVRLMKLDTLKVKVRINEKNLADIYPDQEVKISVDAYPGERFRGTVYHIKKMLDAGTHTAMVEIVVSNDDERLKPGMFCRVSVIGPEEAAVFIPRQAIMHQAGTGLRYVFVVKDGFVERRVIEEIKTDGALIAVSGVVAEEMVITGGKNKVLDGACVSASDGGGK